MADKKPERKRQITTTVSPETFKALTDIRFDKRHEKLTDTVREAVEEYVSRHGTVGNAKATK